MNYFSKLTDLIKFYLDVALTKKNVSFSLTNEFSKLTGLIHFYLDVALTKKKCVFFTVFEIFWLPG
jgi:hypothetical protein